MGSAMNGLESKSQGKPKMVGNQKKKGKPKSKLGSDIGIKNPRYDRDRLYEWAMWRMYLNEDMSQALFSAHAPSNRAHKQSANKSKAYASKNNSKLSTKSPSVSGVASVYIKNPVAMKYGRMMKNISAGKHWQDAIDNILPDNVYLVYGLPRICLARDMPTGIRELHDSMELLSTREHSMEDTVETNVDTDNCINKLFEFVSDEMKDGVEEVNKSERTTVILDQQATPAYSTDREHYNGLHGKPDDLLENNNDKNDAPLPLVSKSRQFWEKLAYKKAEIIDIGKSQSKDKYPQKSHAPNGAISNDILLNQQKLLRKTKPKPRSSRDLWRSLAERKTEILQLKDWDEKSGEVKKQTPKKPESKTSQLWSFIFSKKKELVQMKRGNKTGNAQTQKHESDMKLKSAVVPAYNSSFPDNFQDNFQAELAARLRKFKERADAEPMTVL